MTIPLALEGAFVSEQKWPHSSAQQPEVFK